MPRGVNCGDPRLQLGAVEPGVPQLAQPRQAARNQAQPAARAASGGGRGGRARFAARDHLPVDIVGRAVEIEHRARRMGDQQRRPGRRRHGLRQPVDMAVFEPQRRALGVAQPRGYVGGIGPARVRHRDQHRDRRDRAVVEPECGHAPQSGNCPAGPQRIGGRRHRSSVARRRAPVKAALGVLGTKSTPNRTENLNPNRAMTLRLTRRQQGHPRTGQRTATQR